MHKRYKKLFTDTGLFVVSVFGSKILTFLLLPLYTSILSTEEYGMADIVVTTVNFLYPILTLSTFEATLRFALDEKYNKKRVFDITLIFSLMAIIIFSFIMHLFLEQGFLKEYWWCILGLFASNVFQICLSYYVKGCGQTKIFAIQGVLYTLVCLSANIILLVGYGCGLKGYLMSMCLAGIISSIYMLFSSNTYRELIPFRFDKDLSKEMLRYCVPLIPTTIAWWINAYSDKYMILAFVGISVSGLYGVAHKISTVFSTITNLFSQAWRISAISSFDDEDNQAYYEKVYKIYSLICIYTCLFIIFSAEILVKTFFRNEYYTVWTFIPPLLLAALFQAYAGFFESLYAAAKQTVSLSISIGIGALLNIVLNYMLIKYFGGLGAPIATMFSFSVVWWIRFKMMQSFMPININLARTLPSLGILIACGLYFSFQGLYRYIVGAFALVLIVALNLQETLYIVSLCIKVMQKIKIRRKK